MTELPATDPTQPPEKIRIQWDATPEEFEALQRVMDRLQARTRQEGVRRCVLGVAKVVDQADNSLESSVWKAIFI